MNSFKTAALCFGLAIGAVAVPALAETPATTKTEPAKTEPAKTEVAKPDNKTPMAKTDMSEADKRAKAIDCSKQADAKKLHGEERKKFRSECKRKM